MWELLYYFLIKEQNDSCVRNESTGQEFEEIVEPTFATDLQNDAKVVVKSARSLNRIVTRSSFRLFFSLDWFMLRFQCWLVRCLCQCIERFFIILSPILPVILHPLSRSFALFCVRVTYPYLSGRFFVRFLFVVLQNSKESSSEVAVESDSRCIVQKGAECGERSIEESEQVAAKKQKLDHDCAVSWIFGVVCLFF